MFLLEFLYIKKYKSFLVYSYVDLLSSNLKCANKKKLAQVNTVPFLNSLSLISPTITTFLRRSKLIKQLALNTCCLILRKKAPILSLSIQSFLQISKKELELNSLYISFKNSKEKFERLNFKLNFILVCFEYFLNLNTGELG